MFDGEVKVAFSNCFSILLICLVLESGVAYHVSKTRRNAKS